MSIIQGHAKSSGVSAFYSQEIGGSLRFNMAGGPNLTRTMGTATDGTKCTISFWVKKNDIVNSTTTARFMSAYSGTGNQFHMQWGDGTTSPGDQWSVSPGEQSSQQGMRQTDAALRDPSAWYHCVWSYNSTSGSESVVLYVNGVAQTSPYTDAPTTNLVTSATKSGTVLYIGYVNSSSLDIQLAEMHLIDGQALDPTSFGEFKSGAWIPKEYSGLYGNNGFYFDFTSANYSNPNMLDISGNSNNFAASGGIDTHDFVLDSPTNSFATLNPSFYFGGSIDDGNLKHTSGGSWVGAPSTFGMGSGKWYAEFIARDANNISVGVMATEGDTQKNLGTSNLGYMGKYSDSYGWVNNFGTVYKANNDVTSSYGSAPSNDDIIRVAFDADNGELYVGKGATWFNSSDPATNTSPMYSSIPTTNTFYYFASGLENGNGVWNFGQDSTFAGATTAGGNSDDNGYGDFKYAVPSGYLALCTANLPTPAADPESDVEPRDYFETFLYTGNGAGLQVGDVIKKPADTTTISNSLIFNDDDSAYLSRTPSLGDSRKKFTFSAWLKVGSISGWPQTEAYLFSVASGSDNTNNFYFKQLNTGQLRVSGYSVNWITTDAKLVDSSRWYHVVLACDSDASSGERIRIYVDGIEVKHSETDPSPSQNFAINMAAEHRIGQHPPGYNYPWGGTMAEIHFLDGYQEGPTTFGNFDANGIWIPKAVTGIAYGTNGFYLDFSDNTNTTKLGEDQAGSNDWTLNNFATTDQVSDSPTDNFATLDGSLPDATYNIDQLSEGNLSYNVSQGNNGTGRPTGSLTVKSGKWYWEVQMPSAQNSRAVGFCRADKVNQEAVTLHGSGFTATNSVVGVSLQDLTVDQVNSTGTHTEHQNSISSISNNDWIGITVDLDAGTFRFYKQGIAWSNEYELQDLQLWQKYGMRPTATAATYQAFVYNFGQRSFNYTPPTGYLAISENNITVDDQNLESPDLVWIKSRGAARHSGLWDSVRGARQLLQTSSTDLETDRPYGVLNFNTNGFTLGPEDPSWHYNELGINEVAWCWKAGTSFSNSAGTNDASIASSGSVNTESGFSITTFTATGSNETVAHGLSAKPDMIIIIRRDASGSDQIVYHSSLGATKNLRFNNSDEARTDSTFFNNTEPTSSVFTIGGTRFADTRTYVAYCFSGKEGYSRLGLYKDSAGSDYNKDSPFIYLGFKPAWILIKSTSTGRAWAIYDNKRTPVNPAYLWLQTSTATEQSDSTNMDIDFMANGFKVKGGSGLINTTGEEYVFAAFAEMPLKYATAR